jgi:tetratricopeptide (TPR) repeat protein
LRLLITFCMVCALSTLGSARITWHPDITLGSGFSNNFYSTSTPNIEVLSYQYSIGNTLSMYHTSWLSSDLYTGYDSDVDTKDPINTTQSYIVSLSTTFSPTPALELTTSGTYLQYTMDRYVSSNVRLTSLSEYGYWYLAPDQYIVLSAGISQYDYYNSTQNATKQSYKIGYQDPSNLYVWLGYAAYTTDTASSEYTDVSVGIETSFWLFNSSLLSLSGSYSDRTYTESDLHAPSMDLELGFRYYFNGYWSSSLDVAYYSDLSDDPISATQATLSMRYTDSFVPFLTRTNKTTTDFVYDDATHALDNANNLVAAALLNRVLFFEPSHASALFDRAFLYHHAEDYQHAIPLFERAIALDPTMEEAYLLLAYDLIQTGQRKQAKRMLLQGVAYTGNPTMQRFLRRYFN